MMPLLESIIKYGILHWFFSVLRFTYLLCLFRAEINDFNPFFKISGQKIMFLNLNNFLKYCPFWECSCIVACELAGISCLGVGYVCVSIYWTVESIILRKWNLKTRKQGVYSCTYFWLNVQFVVSIVPYMYVGTLVFRRGYWASCICYPFEKNLVWGDNYES